MDHGLEINGMIEALQERLEILEAFSQSRNHKDTMEEKEGVLYFTFRDHTEKAIMTIKARLPNSEVSQHDLSGDFHQTLYAISRVSKFVKKSKLHLPSFPIDRE